MHVGAETGAERLVLRRHEPLGTLPFLYSNVGQPRGSRTWNQYGPTSAAHGRAIPTSAYESGRG